MEGGREIQRSLPLGQGGYPPVGGPHEHQGDGQHGQDQGEVPLWGASFLRETLSIEYNARAPQFVTEFHKKFFFFQRGPQKAPSTSYMSPPRPFLAPFPKKFLPVSLAPAAPPARRKKIPRTQKIPCVFFGNMVR